MKKSKQSRVVIFLQNHFGLLIKLSVVLTTVGVFFWISVFSQRAGLLQFEERRIKISQIIYNSLTDLRKSVINTDISKLSPAQKAGSTFLIGIPGTQPSQQTVDFINKYHVTGVVIMGNNVQDKQQLKNLIADLKNKSDHKLLIAVDQEGWPVARIPWDPNANKNPAVVGKQNTLAEITAMSKVRSETLREVGIDINFSPVADLSYAGSAIGSRSYGSDPAKVSGITTSIMQGQREGGVITTAKHFPGLGKGKLDSHLNLPQIKGTVDDLKQSDLIPFSKLISSGVDMIMVGHALYTDIDSTAPASLSPVIITSLLRQDLGFKGLIISDDMKMKALDRYSNKYARSISAGMNLMILIDTFPATEKAINELSASDQQLLSNDLQQIYTFLYK